MAEVVYNIAKTRIAQGLTDLDGGDIRAAVVITSKTGAADPDLGTMAAIDAVGTVAFHSERVTLSGLTVTQDNANDRANVDCANFSFVAAAGVTALAIIIYDNAAGGSDTTRYPIAFYDTGFGAGLPMDGGLNVTVNDYLRIA